MFSYEKTIQVNGVELDIYKEEDTCNDALNKYNRERYVKTEDALDAFDFSPRVIGNLFYMDEGLMSGIVGDFMNVGLLRSLLFTFTSLKLLDEFDRSIGLKK